MSTLPELTVALFNLLIALVNMLLESFDSLKQTVENQSKIIRGPEADHELIKSLRNLLNSKNVDLDALKRLVFQGGREQKKEPPAPKETTEKPQSKRQNSKTREMQNNKSKQDCCDVEQADFHDVNRKVLGASTREDVTAEVPQQIEKDGKKVCFQMLERMSRQQSKDLYNKG